MGMACSALKYSHHFTLQNEDLCTAGTVHTLANQQTLLGVAVLFRRYRNTKMKEKVVPAKSTPLKSENKDVYLNI